MGRWSAVITSTLSSFVALAECDISSEEAVAAAVAATVDCFGRLDVLVNCAAAFVFGDVEETTVEMWNKVLQVNVIGTDVPGRVGWWWWWWWL